MLHFRSLDELSLHDTWLTIGVFDGVHRGHQVILDHIVYGAHAMNARAAVITFDPHPAVVLGGKTDFKYLTTPDERLALLEAFGVDLVITQTFTRQFAHQTAEEFMGRVSKTLGLRHLTIGYDTALGRGREGNADRLTAIGKKLGYIVEVISPLADEAGIISSTRIRGHVLNGEMVTAARELGRYYAITGPVIHGDGRGRTIDIPTANLSIPAEKIIPANGVYACWAWVDGKKHQAVINIGIRPTFTPEEFAPHVEAHLLDFNRDLYGQQVRLEFVSHLRTEQKFPSVEALVAQIHLDIKKAAEILQGEK